MSMIHLQLKQISRNPGAIQTNHKTIATWFLWAIWFEISNKPQQFGKELHPTQHQLLELWDQLHLTNPAPGAIYLEVLLNCINVNCLQIVGGPGSEKLAIAASLYLLHVLSGLDLTSMVAKYMHQHYTRVIPHHVDFTGLPCYHMIDIVHIMFVGKWEGHSFCWTYYAPQPQEHTLFANTVVQIAHKAKEHQEKVPHWILHFVLHSLSLDPLPSTSVIVNCLSIIAIDQDCNVLSTKTTTVDEGCVPTLWALISLTQNQCTAG